jgi:ribosomal protein S18 acetylase RimI-like enzyme
VRDAVLSDAPAISALGRVAFAELHEGLLSQALIDVIIDETYSVASLSDCIARCSAEEGAHFLVAQRGGDLIGYLHYDSAESEPELHRLYVDPRYKRAGIGGALLCEHHARLRPGASYILVVFAANQAAIQFYRAHGLHEGARVGAYPFLGERAEAICPPDTPAVPAVIMRFTSAAQ